MMRFRVIILVALLLSCGLASAQQSRSTQREKRSGPIFIFHADEFWLSLHHFLYVLGRAQNKTRDSTREAVLHAPEDERQVLATLNANEQAIWREAVASY